LEFELFSCLNVSGKFIIFGDEPKTINRISDINEIQVFEGEIRKHHFNPI
jgi:hypothetical protein